MQFLQQLALTLVQLGRRLHPYFDEKIAFAMPVEHRHAFVPQLQHCAGLRTFGNFQHLLAFEGRNLNLRAQSSLSKGDGHHAMQVRSLALKERVILHMQDDVKVPWRPALHARFPEPAETNPSFFFHPGGNFRFNRLLLDDASFALALRAGITHDRTRTLACWACSGDAEESLLISHLASATASTAGGRSLAISAARAFAGVALLVTAIRNLLLGPEDRFLKFDCDVFAQVSPTLSTRAAAAAAASAKDVAEAEELAEDVVEILENASVKAAASCRAAYTGMPEAVIHAALFGVGQDRIGLAALLKFFFGIRIVGIAVRMVLQRQLAVSALDLLLARAPLDPKYLVVVSFYVARQSLTLAN